MKIMIETDAKIVSIGDNVNLKELFDTLSSFFPNGEWKEYKLVIFKEKDTEHAPVAPFIPWTTPWPWEVPTTPKPPWWEGPIIISWDKTISSSDSDSSGK